MMRMHNPSHPGEIIKRLCLDPLRVSVIPAAQALGDTEQRRKQLRVATLAV